MRRLVEDFPEELGSLYPPKLAKKITALEEEMEIEIGAYARQIAYTFVLDRKFLKKAGSWFTRGTSTVEKVLFDRAKPMVAAGMVNIMRCRYSRIPAGVEVIMKYFDKIGRILEKQPYICGDEFTAADLTFVRIVHTNLKVAGTLVGWSTLSVPPLQAPLYSPTAYWRLSTLLFC